jgi:hypothetical protein
MDASQEQRPHARLVGRGDDEQLGGLAFRKGEQPLGGFADEHAHLDIIRELAGGSHEQRPAVPDGGRSEVVAGRVCGVAC